MLKSFLLDNSKEEVYFKVAIKYLMDKELLSKISSIKGEFIEISKLFPILKESLTEVVIKIDWVEFEIRNIIY